MLKAKRKAACLTQTVVAERLKKPSSYVAKYEGGDRRLDVLEFLDVAEAIGFEPGRFIRDLRQSGSAPPKSQPLRTGRPRRR